MAIEVNEIIDKTGQSLEDFLNDVDKKHQIIKRDPELILYSWYYVNLIVNELFKHGRPKNFG